MKLKTNFYLIGGLVFALAACNSSDKEKEKNIIEASAVPEAVLTNFESRFMNGDSLVWSFEDQEYEADFIKNGKRFEASFLPDGELISVEADMPIEAFPANISSYLDANYSGAIVIEAARVMNKEGNFHIIEIELKGEEINLIFDTEGNFVRVKAN